MKAVFNDFLRDNPNCSGFLNNSDAIALFDFLSKDESIIKMIEASEAGKPALMGCLHDVEVMFKNCANFSLNDKFTKTAVGRMVKTILEPFGYLPDKQRTFSSGSGAVFFKSAHIYKKTGDATMEVVKTIRSIKKK